MNQLIVSNNNQAHNYSCFWLDNYTIKNIQCVTTNIFFQINGKVPFPIIGIANIPLRVWSSFSAYRDQNYWKIAGEISAFAVLFFSGGIKVAIALDLINQGINIFLKVRPFFNRGPLDVYTAFRSLGYNIPKHNPLDVEGAIKILSMDTCREKTQDKKFLIERYSFFYKERDNLYQRLSEGNFNLLAQRYLQLRNDTKIAYQTLLKTYHSTNENC